MNDNLFILQAALEEAATPTMRAEALLNIGAYYFDTDDFILQEQAARQALSLAQDIEDAILCAKAYQQLGLVAHRTGDYNEALEHHYRALVLFEEKGDKHGIAAISGSIGGVHDNLGEYSIALEYNHRALALHEEMGNQVGTAVVACNIGLVHEKLSEYSLALEYYHRSLALSEQIGYKLVVANTTCNIGLIYYYLSEYDVTLGYLIRSLALHTEIDNRLGIANVTGNIGAVYNKLQDNGTALEYYHRALVLHEELEHKRGAADVTTNIGTAYNDLLEYSAALEYYHRALELYEELGDKFGIVHSTSQVGRVYAKPDFAEHNPQEAEKYLLSALSINEEVGSKDETLSVHKTLADLYEGLERWQEAYEHHRKFYAIEKEVQSEEVKKQAQKYDYERKLGEERARKEASDRILHNILPISIAERLKANESPIADHYESVSILFMDIVNFTPLSARVAANQLLHLLDSIFSICDAVIKEYGLEKIKTIGDSYMAVCGLPEEREDHAEAAAGAAIEMLQRLNALRINIPEQLQGDRSWLTDELALKVRIGLHCGPVVAGVIGSHKFAYDLWGDTVNTASRMESHSEAGHIHVSEDFYKQIKMSYSCEERGEMEIKGKGRMKTYFLRNS